MSRFNTWDEVRDWLLNNPGEFVAGKINHYSSGYWSCYNEDCCEGEFDSIEDCIVWVKECEQLDLLEEWG